MPDIDEIADRIDARIVSAREEILRLTATRAVLIGESSLSTRRRRTPDQARGRPRARYSELVDGDLERELEAEPAGLSSNELARRTHAHPVKVRAWLHERKAAGTVAREGDRRATRWSLLSDGAR